MKKKQTSVEWFLEELLSNDDIPYRVKQLIRVDYLQAEQMNQKQIEMAYLKGAMDVINNIESTPTIYYNETYGK